MATTRALQAGQAFIKATIDDRGVQKGLDKLERRVHAIGGQLRRLGSIAATVGGVITGAFAVAVRTFGKVGDQLDKMSARTGASVEFLSALGFAAEQSGSGIDAVESSLLRMQKALFDAGRGLKEPNDALAKLGLTVADLSGLSPDEQFVRIANAISQIGDPTEQAGIAMSLFGRGVRELLPLIKSGSIDALAREAADLGIVMSTEDATAAAELTDALNRLNRQVRMMIVQVGASIAGPLTEFAGIVTPIAKAVIEWLRANRQLVAGVAAAGAVILAAGTALVGFGAAIQLASVGIAGIVSLFGVLASPVVIITAAIGSLGVAFLRMSKTGRAITQDIATSFSAVRAHVGEVLTTIAKLLSAGQLEAAGNLAMANLRFAFESGWAYIRNGAAEAARFTSEVWLRTIDSISRFFVHLRTGIIADFNRIKNTAANIGDQMMTSFLAHVTRMNALRAAAARAVSNPGMAGTILQEELAKAEAINRERQAAATASQQGRTGEMQAANAELVREQEEILNRLTEQLNAAIEANNEKASDRLKEIEEDRQRAEDELRKTLDEANRLAEQTMRERADFELGAIGEDMDAAIGSPGRSVSTFDTRLAEQMFGRDDIQKQQLDEAKKMAKNLDIIRRRMQEGGGLAVV